jgi:hypothetical protein
MKKTILTVILVVTSFILNAQQGIITVKDKKADVLVAQLPPEYANIAWHKSMFR